MHKLENFGLFSSVTKRDHIISLIPVSVRQFGALMKQETPEHREWIKANNFAGLPGQVLPVPDKNTGKIAAYYFGLPKDKGLYSLAPLTNKLPAGKYAIANMEQYFDSKQAQQALLGWSLDSYRFDNFKNNPKKTNSPRLLIPSFVNKKALLSEASSVYMVRDLINRPASDLGPKALGKEVKKLASQFNCAAKMTKGKALLENDYPLIHAVGRASDQAPRLVDFTWGDDNHPKITLIGKGITFDSGGLDKKPSASMYGMEKDMGGAANAMGLAKMIMEANLPVRLRVLIPIAENAISKKAYRPGDLLHSRKNNKGISTCVEIGNTDAEGRLILADAISEASSENPDIMIDFATLTGAQRVAHGGEIGGILGTDKKMLRDLEDLGEETDDYLAMLPLHQRYKSGLTSRKADIKSTGGQAGAITAALFLQHFVKAGQWVHIDISGSNAASSPARPAGGEAMGIRTMFRYLENKFG